MTFRVFLAVLVASGCTQTQKITANECEVVAYQTIGGGNGYTSGIHYPEGGFHNFAEFALIDDHELIRQRNWGISTDQQQFCAVQVTISKSPNEAARLNEAAQDKREICGEEEEYAALLQAIRASWQQDELQSAIAQNCGAS
jgi:hypothetical protein